MHKNMPTNAYQQIVRVTEGPFPKEWRCLLAVLALLQFSLIINASWRAQPDAALYLELGESLAAGRGYVFNGEPHTYVPPAYPALIALVSVFFGKNMLYYRILMSGLGLTTGLLSYLLIRRVCGKETALLLGVFCLTSHVLLENSTITCSDTLFAFSVFLALHVLLCVEVKGPDPWILVTAFSGIVAGMPALVRINGWGIPPALTIYLAHATQGRSFLRRVVQSILFLIAGAAPAAIWEAYKSSFPRSMNEGTYMNAVLGRDLWTQLSIMLTALKDYAHEITYACTGMSIRTGFLEFVIPLLIIVGLLKLMRKGERLFGPLVLIQMAGLCFSPAGSRYLIALLPAFSIFLVAGVTCVSDVLLQRLLCARSQFRLQKRIASIFILVLIVLNVSANTFTIIQARYALEPNGAESYRDEPFFAASRWLKQSAEGGPIMSMHPRVIHYLSGLPTIELVRSGVSENQTFISSQDELIRIISVRRPTYLFSDSKNHSMKTQVETAFQKMGATLQEIPCIDQNGRFALWKVLYPKS